MIKETIRRHDHTAHTIKTEHAFGTQFMKTCLARHVNQSVYCCRHICGPGLQNQEARKDVPDQPCHMTAKQDQKKSGPHVPESSAFSNSVTGVVLRLSRFFPMDVGNGHY